MDRGLPLVLVPIAEPGCCGTFVLDGGVPVGVVILGRDTVEVLSDLAITRDERRAQFAPVPVPVYACITASCATKSCGGGPSTSPGANICTFIIMP